MSDTRTWVRRPSTRTLPRMLVLNLTGVARQGTGEDASALLTRPFVVQDDLDKIIHSYPSYDYAELKQPVDVRDPSYLAGNLLAMNYDTICIISNETIAESVRVLEAYDEHGGSPPTLNVRVAAGL